MATMGKYCKAYSLKKLREFSQWTECAENAKRENQSVEGKEVESNRELTDLSTLKILPTRGCNDNSLHS
ncbi:hypothetical protein [Nostoc sp. DedQUE04]|uniref:hypothetical protein n=1 Tax=Nostoc sp. DedQUE04 TaxID=3075390 RepID=UPI002AD3EEFF|nr:hypothetical protein [Nostoc sp. DedQUE04]